MKRSHFGTPANPGAFLTAVLSSQGQERKARTIMLQTRAIARASGLEDVVGAVTALRLEALYTGSDGRGGCKRSPRVAMEVSDLLSES